MSVLPIQEYVPLAPFTTFHIGGIARRLISAETTEELIAARQYAQEEGFPWHIIAGGSNLIFTQDHLEAMVIHVATSNLSVTDNMITAGAGVPLAHVIEIAIGHELAGLEQLSGIPGTIGGAIVGNAGAYGHAIAEVVESVEVFDGQERRVLTWEQCRFGYRHSVFKEQPLIVLQASLRFQPGKHQELFEHSRRIIRMREAKYHPGIKTAGSFFKNILVSSLSEEQLSKIDQSKIIDGKVPTGYLLDTIGVRSMRVGDIQVADFHGNLLINIGKGTAKDVKELSRQLKEKVRERFGILLEEEVRFIPS